MLLEIKENIPLASFTTFKVGGPARFFAAVRSIEELSDAADFSKKNRLPILILAGGSNLVISSKGFEGLVLDMQMTGSHLDGYLLTAGAATTMKELVDLTINAGLGGLEWAGGLPGSFGGAIRGNAGCFGAEIKDTIQTVTTFSLETKKTRTWSNSNCAFGYRDSYFKQHPTEVIIEATVQLTPDNASDLRQEADSHIQYRNEKHPMEYPSAGSMFKNTPVERVSKEWQSYFEKSVKTDPFPVVPTARIIAETQISGLTVGGAQLSTKHTNYVVNTGSATGEDIVEVVKQVKQKVFEKFGITLETEPEFVGF